MAVDDQPIQAPLSATSTLSSSSSTRRQLVQVATNNSSTFIQFPNTSRQLSCIPTDRPREIHPKVQPFSCETDTRLTSNILSSSIPLTDRTRQRSNPILNNSLLNHRKGQPTSSLIKFSTDYSITTELCLTSKPLKAEFQIPNTRAHTPKTQSSVSDQENDDNDQQETQHMDKSKYDYITRWLQEVERAKSSTNLFMKTKRPKTKCL